MQATDGATSKPAGAARRRIARAAARGALVFAIGSLMLSGCSFVGARSAHTTPSGQVVCTSTYAPPVLDTLIALAGTSLIVWGGTDEKNEEGGEAPSQNFAALPGLILLVPFALSALYGYAKVGGCKAAAGRAR